MKFEKSCGAFILKDNKVLLIKSKKGEYGFPKGHIEYGETEEETAIREVKEETNISININSKFRYDIEYNIKDNILKEVVYYLGIVIDDSNIVKQDSEIDAIFWVDIDKVNNCLKYDNIKKIWNQFLTEYKM
ncbi:MAG TPA: NUDIX domain-containing protein [Bacilli bacterium]|nr:NUDIX domain-containing protein [Bacilli bacterium]